MTKLNQILAVEKGVKSKSDRELTDYHHRVQKAALLSGISRSYQPKDDDGEQLPPESTRVQVNVEAVLDDVSKTLTRLFDVTATKDFGNVKAKADVVVDGVVLVEDAPVPYLLFLEKQLVDLVTFVRKLPTLDPSENWTVDTASDSFKADITKTVRTKKVPRNHVKAPATDKHPAQVELYYEDVSVGYWSTVKFSGALPAARVRELAERVDKLQAAVKFAREEANATEIDDQHIGEGVFGYLFG